jgi:hypothetical protein
MSGRVGQRLDVVLVVGVVGVARVAAVAGVLVVLHEAEVQAQLAHAA